MIKGTGVALILLFLFHEIISAQTLIKQFQQTKYDFKDLCMVDTSTGWAAGEVHWDQNEKQYKGTILITSNGGVDWSEQDVGINEDLWDIHFIDDKIGWAVGDSGTVVHTVDGGDTWIKQDMSTELDIKSVHFFDALSGWAVANEIIHSSGFGDPDAWHGKIFHTENGGENWTEQSLPEDAGLIHGIYFMDNLKGWAVGVRNDNLDFFAETRCALYYTEDGGESWIEKYAPDIDLVFTDIDFTTEEKGWVVGFAGNSGETGGTVFRTIDGGDTWQRIAEDYTFWKVDFIDSLKGYAVGTAYNSAWGPPVVRTTNGGDSWESIKMENHDGYTGFYGLKVFENKVIAVGDKGYIAVSTDPWGAKGFPHGENLFTQKFINVLYEFEDLFFINDTKGWVAGQKSVGPDEWAQVILHTDNGGQSWTEQYSQTTEWMSNCLRLNAVQFVSETKGWAVGHSADVGTEQTTGILYTDDGGQTWEQQAQGVSEGQIVDVFFLDDQNGWALTDAQSFPDMSIQLLKTTNGGSLWELVNTGQTGNITIGYAIKTGKLYFQDTTTGWVLGAQCTLLKTNDGGENWAKVILPEEYYNTHSIVFCDENYGIICGETTFKTVDGGASWTKRESFDYTMTDVCFTGSAEGWMVGEWCEIYKTTDKGISWNPVEHTLSPAAIKAVSFPNKNFGWTAGRGGVIVKIDDSDAADFEQSNNIPSGFQLLQNFPNPFNPHTKIVYKIQNPGRVSLTVYNIMGEKIITLIDDFRTFGSYSVSWDGRDNKEKTVSSGVYIYKLSGNNRSISKKMFLVK